MASDSMSTETSPAMGTQRDFRVYSRILLKYAPLIIIITVITTGIAVLYSFAAQKVFQARVMLRIERQSANPFPNINNLYLENNQDFDYFQTQIKLFKSRSLAKATLEELKKNGNPFKPEGITSAEGAVSAFLRKIDVNPELRSQLLFLVVEDENKQLAQIYANTHANMYISETIKRRVETVEGYTEWFKTRTSIQEQDILAKEKELQAFKFTNNIDQLTTIISTAQATIRNAESQISELSAQKNAGSLDDAALSAANKKIKDLQAVISREKNRMTNLDKFQAEANMLEMKVQTARNEYQNLLRLYTQVTMTKDFNPQNITIIDEAQVPSSPARPKLILNLAFGFLLGLIIGISTSFILEYLDDTIKTPTDVESFLRVPFIGLIPSLDSREKIPVEGIVEMQPKGAIAENYRAIRTNILFSSGKPIRQMVLTSAGPGEGKTTTSVNIAQVMAKSGDKTLLVDADMRRPRLRKLFAMDQNIKGLSNFLIGNASCEEIIHPTATEGLFLIPSGPIPPNPVELLNHPRLKELMEYVGRNFDRVIYDTPPVIAVTDSAILARLADGVIFSVHGGHSHRDVVKRGIDTLRKVGSNIFGVVLNNVNIYRASYYDYYYYNYYRYAYEYAYRRQGDEKGPKIRKKRSEKTQG